MAEADQEVILLLTQKRVLKSSLYLLRSYDGIKFKRDDSKITITKSNLLPENISLCENFRVSYIVSPKETYVLTYIRRVKNKKPVLVLAYSTDLYNWKIKEEFDARDTHTALVIQAKSSPTTLYRDGLFISAENLDKPEHMRKLLFTSRHNQFDEDPLTLLGGEITNHGNLLIYDTSFGNDEEICLQAGAALVDPLTQKVTWRSDVPVSQVIIKTTRDAFPSALGSFILKNTVYIYWSVSNEIIVSSFLSPFKDVVVYHPPHHHIPLLKKHSKNPILRPHPHNEWESEAVFNPAAIYDGGKVHILYRALGPQGISVLGYASSVDGHSISERHRRPAYHPRQVFEGSEVDTSSIKVSPISSSGGGFAGIEDPKLTILGSKVYLTYVAFSGWDSIRVAISWISKKDFNAHKWDKWSEPVLMSRPNTWICDKEWDEWGRRDMKNRPDQRYNHIDKSACLLPEKINGKYVIFHRVYPDILVDYVDDLRFGKNRWLKNEFKISPREGMWDSRKLSIGAPPLKTKYGWLAIYHAVDDRDPGKYKVGAMLLDLKHPEKVLHRSNAPLLIPDMHYENDGKPGIAYPCGAVIIDDILHMYYGGGDKVVCVATAPVNTLVNHLINENPDPFKLNTK